MIRVLIVDDKPENLYLLRMLLQGHGCTVDEARHGVEALTEARRTPPDLIISDLQMPVMDGYTLLREWKADRQLRGIPFVVYTATYTEPRDEHLALSLGADAFMIKPIEPEPFMDRIKEVMTKTAQGELPPVKTPAGTDVDLFREYSGVLIHKLERKVAELEQANQALQEEIARRREAEAALLKARRDWEITFQSIFHPAVILDLDHRIVEANKRFIELTGKPLEELLNAEYHEVLRAEGEQPCTYPAHFPVPSASSETIEIEMEALGRHFVVCCTPIPDEEGIIRRVIHMAIDVTERREMEDILRKSEDRYRRIYDEAPVMMQSIDKDRVVRGVNRRWQEKLGYSPEEIVGRKIEVILTPESRETLSSVLPIFWETGDMYDVPYEYVRKDGTSLNVLLDAIAWDDPTWGTVSLSVVRDVTQTLLLQKQLIQAQKMEAVGTLAGGVAHDFNNILQVALGYSELVLGDEELPPRHKNDIKKINEAARRGADLVQRLLTFGRKTEARPFPINLNRRIRELRKMLERTLPKMIEIQLTLAEDLGTINADGTQIDQILMNLAVNARDAMPDGGRLIFETANIFLDEEYVASHLNTVPGHYVLLTVTDAGTGMDQQTLEHIFEPFYTTKGTGKGTGLGLAMVYGIVQQHGGHIRCSSDPGVGTTFKIYFPALVSEEEPEETSVKEMPRGGTETILLVDDEEMIREIGSRILSRIGYTVFTASNGKEALDVFERRGGEIDLVVLDLIMPEMGGSACLEGLLRLDPSVKVIVASGFSSSDETRETLALGARGFVNKPYELRQVLQVVRDVLDAEQPVV